MTTPEVDLRERLVAATAALIDEEGPLAVRVDKIARRAGCSRATVYRYVADKDELVREVLVSRSAEIAERLEADIDENGDPADWIVNGLLAHAEAIRAEPWFQALDRQGATAAIARVGGGPQAVAGLATPIVARFLNRIAERGALRPRHHHCGSDRMARRCPRHAAQPSLCRPLSRSTRSGTAQIRGISTTNPPSTPQTLNARSCIMSGPDHNRRRRRTPVGDCLKTWDAALSARPTN